MKTLKNTSSKQRLANKKRLSLTKLQAFILMIYLFASPIAMVDSFVIKDQCFVPEGFSQVVPEKEGEDAYLIPGSIKAKVQKKQMNKVSLVNLWALWCPPCLKELPMLDSIANHPDFSVQTIHLGDKAKEVEVRFKTLGIKYLPKDVEPDLTLLSQWGFLGLPATLVLVNQKVTYRHQGYINQSAETLASWLSCLAFSPSYLDH